MFGAQLRLVNLHEPGWAARLVEQEREDVARGVNGVNDRGLAVLDPVRSRSIRQRREGVSRVTDRNNIARAQEVVAVDGEDRLLAEFASIEPLLLGQFVDEIDVRVGAVDDQYRLRRLEAVPPRVPLLDEPSGRSADVPPYTHARWSADLDALGSRLGVGKFTLLGPSYGGIVA